MKGLRDLNDKILSFLGLARRAGKLILGNDAAIESVKKKKACLILLAGDISENTGNKAVKTAEEYNIEHIKLDRTKEQIMYALGKYSAVMSVIDKGFAERIKVLYEQGKDGISI